MQATAVDWVCAGEIRRPWPVSHSQLLLPLSCCCLSRAMASTVLETPPSGSLPVSCCCHQSSHFPHTHYNKEGEILQLKSGWVEVPLHPDQWRTFGANHQVPEGPWDGVFLESPVPILSHGLVNVLGNETFHLTVIVHRREGYGWMLVICVLVAVAEAHWPVTQQETVLPGPLVTERKRGLLLLFYRVFCGFLVVLFLFTMWDMLQMLKDRVPKYQLPSSGLKISPEAVTALKYAFSMSDSAS